MVCSRGSISMSVRSTVRPPTPLSNTPMGASACTSLFYKRRGWGVHLRCFSWHEQIRDKADAEHGAWRLVGEEDDVPRADAGDGEGMEAFGHAVHRGAI